IPRNYREEFTKIMLDFYANVSSVYDISNSNLTIIDLETLVATTNKQIQDLYLAMRRDAINATSKD
ncbi:MAG: hypothetical protein LBO66_08920, partial [Deltaproteobacteria bacterium]|nr:hypothetical protein [Deltaproteobacteria bacterium]